MWLLLEYLHDLKLGPETNHLLGGRVHGLEVLAAGDRFSDRQFAATRSIPTVRGIRRSWRLEQPPNLMWNVCKFERSSTGFNLQLASCQRPTNHLAVTNKYCFVKNYSAVCGLGSSLFFATDIFWIVVTWFALNMKVWGVKRVSHFHLWSSILLCTVYEVKLPSYILIFNFLIV